MVFFSSVVAVVADAPGCSVAEVAVLVVEVAALPVVVSLFDCEQASSVSAAEI
jgi:hypothetical protein